MQRPNGRNKRGMFMDRAEQGVARRGTMKGGAVGRAEGHSWPGLTVCMSVTHKGNNHSNCKQNGLTYLPCGR